MPATWPVPDDMDHGSLACDPIVKQLTHPIASPTRPELTILSCGATRSPALFKPSRMQSVGLAIASWATSTGAATLGPATLGLISLMVFHVGCDKRSDRVLPGRNPAVSANQFAGIIIAIAIFIVISGISNAVRVFATSSFGSLPTTSASSWTRLSFRKISRVRVVRIGFYAIIHQLKVIVYLRRIVNKFEGVVVMNSLAKT